MREFNYSANPSRVIFGTGTTERIGEEASRLMMTNVLVLSTPQQTTHAQRVQGVLGAIPSSIFSEAKMHTPVEVTQRALAVLGKTTANGIISIGGGSTIGLGKAIAVRTGLPHLTVPTTYAGSEATPILGETENGRKVTRIDPKILPNTIVYDVDHTLSLPQTMTVTSAFNAIAHAAEALYARDSNPIVTLMAADGVRAIISGLPKLVDDPINIGARSDLLYGAWLCGFCLGAVGMSLHHKLCHTLGGMFDLPHSELHTALLPHALAYNAPEIGDALDTLKSATGMNDVPTGLYAFAKSLGAEMSLHALGMPSDGVQSVVSEVLSKPYWNPRQLDGAAIASLLTNALQGNPPQHC